MIVSVRWDLSVVLICIPPIISNDESSSHVLIDHLNVIFGEIFIQILCPFFNLAIWFFCHWAVVLPILGINPYQIYNSQIFSSTGCLFILLIVSFDVKSFKLDVVPFLYFCSYSLCFWWHIQTNLGIDSGVNITWYQELLLSLLDVVTACVFKKESFLRFAHSLFLFTFLHWRWKWQPTPVFLPGESQGQETGGLLSMGSHRAGHDWRDLAAAAAAEVK